MQQAFHFPISDFSQTKWQLLNWASRFNSCCFLDNHQYNSPWQQLECLVAAGCQHQLLLQEEGPALPQLDAFLQQHAGQWLFGHLGFGLGAETCGVNLPEADRGFGRLQWFVPQHVVQLGPKQLTVYAASATEALQTLHQIAACATEAPVFFSETSLAQPVTSSVGACQPKLSRAAYLQTVERLQQHIRRGDCYEINFCQEFEVIGQLWEPVWLYQQLSQLSPNPFSCLYRQGPNYLVCASPERYIQKKGSAIISQPIKGTAPRNLNDADADAGLAAQLRHSTKDQRENVMVVDLVRNDLSKVCSSGTVQVQELFGVYTYPQVHQMISTIAGELLPGTTPAEIFAATFPMGSMTGAPKQRVLELIAQYEPSARGLFSGSVAYINPQGDLDANVVIRSMQYDAEMKRLSFHVGSGITAYSKPHLEYDECMWKAAAIMQVLGISLQQEG